MSNNSILIVEDESLVARDIQNRLTKQGYAFAGWACSAEDAIAQVEKSSPDLVLMDINLRGPVDGIEAAEQIRQRFDVPVVFVTAFADQETLNRAKIADPFGYILKPFSERELHSTIEIALYKHRIDHSLREQRAFLEALFQSVPVSVAVVGDDSRVRMVNDHFIESYGLERSAGIEARIGELLGCPRALEHPDECGAVDGCDGCRIRHAVDRALGGEAVAERGVRFDSRSDGEVRELTLAVTTAPLVHGAEKLAILILDDITELSGLRRVLGSEKSFAGIVGVDPKMVEIFNTVKEIADINVPVMVLGESGTGKELVARAIHDQGVRSSKNFVPVNCGALPDSLLESELFGHVRGAFTGASRDRKGRFQLADRGTIFLDEIGDLSPAMQVKFLRVLQEGTFEPVGGERTVKVDARVICATNKDLEHEVEVGSFREDLFYRLCVVPITLPPLRDRRDDIPLISQHIIEMESASSGGRRKKLSPEVLEIFAEHSWPGNVRELQNVLRFAFIKCAGGVIEPEHLPPTFGARGGRTIPPSNTGTGLTEADIAAALDESGGNRSEAAKLLGVSRATFYRHLAKLERSDEQG